MKLPLSLFLLAVWVAGCATPPATQSTDGSPAVPRGGSATSEVVVLWAENASLQTLGIYADGAELGRLKRNRLVRVRLAPGAHELRAKFVGLLGVGMPSAKLKLQCQAGQRHYVLFTYDYQLTGVVPIGSAVIVMGSTDKRFQEIDEQRAREIIGFAGIY